MKCRLRRLFVVAAFLAATVLVQAQTASPVSSGKFRLHKFEQPIGQESYTVTRDGNVLVWQTSFEFTDRGSKVPLEATLRSADDYTPLHFTVKGKTSRMSEVDAEVRVEGSTAHIRMGNNSREQPVAGPFFTIAAYAPVAIQMAMMRYWREHGRPLPLTTLPSSAVRITDRGPETLQINGHDVPLERYSVQGLIWGLETLWTDADNNLAALVSTDAEFDHFEAVREEYESGLASFVASAARDEMVALTELSARFPGRRTGTLAFTGATVIDVTGKPPLHDATIVTRNGKIVALGPARKVKVPSDATQVDVSGKYIIPGLWDMHAHYEQVEWGPIYLAAGITTARDVGNEFDFITAVRDAVNSGKAMGPHMLLAGIVDGDSPFALGVARVNSAADAEEWVKRYHDAGFQQIKIYSSVTSDNVRAVCAAAHKLGMTVTGHVPDHMTAFQAVDDGMDQINHIQFIAALFRPKDYDPRKATSAERLNVMAIMATVDMNSEAVRQAVRFFKKHRTVIDPTMALMEQSGRPADTPATQIEPGIGKVAPELQEQLTSGGMPADVASLGQKIVNKYLEIIGTLHKAGVPIVAGTDQAVPGYSLYRELELYVQSGFTPLEALQSATIVPARVMKVERDSGSLAVGKRADFDILDANPLDDIHNIRSVHRVVSNGVLYDSATLWEAVGFKP